MKARTPRPSQVLCTAAVCASSQPGQDLTTYRTYLVQNWLCILDEPSVRSECGKASSYLHVDTIDVVNTRKCTHIAGLVANGFTEVHLLPQLCQLQHEERISWVCWTGSSELWTARQLLTWKNYDGFCSACPRHVFRICRNATQEWCIYQGGQLKTNAINLIVNHEPPKCTCALWKLSVSFWLHIFWIFFLQHQGSESAVRAVCKDKSSSTCRRQCNSDVCECYDWV